MMKKFITFFFVIENIMRMMGREFFYIERNCRYLIVEEAMALRLVNNLVRKGVTKAEITSQFVYI